MVDTLCTVAECDEAMVRLSAISTRIRAQIEHAVNEARSTRLPIDRDWVFRAREALHHVAAKRMAAQTRRGAMSRAEKLAGGAEKRAASQTEERRFIDAVKRHITPDLFERLWAEVRDDR